MCGVCVRCVCVCTCAHLCADGGHVPPGLTASIPAESSRAALVPVSDFSLSPPPPLTLGCRDAALSLTITLF